MKTALSWSLVCLACASLLIAADIQYSPIDELKTLGPAHGDVAVSSNGEIYVSILSGPRAGIQVYSPEGKYLRNVPNAPNDFHGFVIHREGAGEFIYGARLSGQSVLKLQLDGKVVLTIEGSAIPDELKRKRGDKPILRLTGVDVAPDGRIFAVDGYSTDRIHIFDAQGKYQSTIGGKAEPFGFKTNHKICIDTRFDPPRILCCDRENRRVVHLSLDGKVLGVIPNMKRPAAVAVHGDLAAVAEIEGRVSLLDKDGKTVAALGSNAVKEETATNKVPPAKWRSGTFTAPHGIDFDNKGNLVVTEFNQFGRVLRFTREQAPLVAAKPPLLAANTTKPEDKKPEAKPATTAKPETKKPSTNPSSASDANALRSGGAGNQAGDDSPIQKSTKMQRTVRVVYKKKGSCRSRRRYRVRRYRIRCCRRRCRRR